MDKEKMKRVLECLFFVTNRPLPVKEVCEIVGEQESDVSGLVEEIKDEMEKRGSALQILQVAEGYQMGTREGFGYWVKKLFREQTTFRLTPSAMETLSIVAYKQPITRAEVEEIRGVEVIGVLETLIERKLVKVAGRKETVGRPLLYATTPEFLRHFNLWKISDLPSLEDIAAEAERKKLREAANAQTGVEPGASEEALEEIPPVEALTPAQESSETLLEEKAGENSDTAGETKNEEHEIGG